MTTKISTIMQKVCVELNRCFNNHRGGVSVIYLGMLTMVVMMIFFTLMLDFSIYFSKRTLIKKAIDLSVSAAAMEINVANSKGLETEFVDGGRGNVFNIVIDDIRARNVYYSMLKANVNLTRNKIENNTLCLVVNPKETSLQYIMYKGTQRTTGEVASPMDLEALINTNFDFTLNNVDSHKIYVNGNQKTNEFKKNPYFMVFIKDLEIDGLFKKRTATLVSFQAARLVRQ